MSACAHRVAELERAIPADLDACNDDPQPFRWTASADLIPENIEPIRERAPRPGH